MKSKCTQVQNWKSACGDSFVYNCWPLRASLIERIFLQCRRPWFDSWVWKICWRRDRLPNPVYLGFPCGSAGKESTCNEEDLGSIPGLGRSPGEGKGYPPQYSGLKHSMDYTVHRVTKSRTRLSNFHFGMLGGCIQQIAQNLEKKLGQKVVDLRIKSLQLNQLTEII